MNIVTKSQNETFIQYLKILEMSNIERTTFLLLNLILDIAILIVRVWHLRTTGPPMLHQLPPFS